MMAGQRMFDGETYQVLSKVADADFIAPEEAAPGWPDAAYRILHKALAKTPENRYQSCREMRDDIDNFRRSQSIRPTAGDLSAYMLNLFADEYAGEQLWVQEVLKRSQQAFPIDSEPTPWIDTGIETVIIKDAASAVEESSKTRTRVEGKRDPLPAVSIFISTVAAISSWLKTAASKARSEFTTLMSKFAGTTPLIKLSVSITAVAALAMVIWWWPQPAPQQIEQASTATSVKRFKITPSDTSPPPSTTMVPAKPKEAPQPQAPAPAVTAPPEKRPEAPIPAPETTPHVGGTEPKPQISDPQPEPEKRSEPPAPEAGSPPSTVYYPPAPTSTAKTEKAVVRHKVNFLLSKATEKLNQYQLTSPPNNCALYYYHKVLALDPENNEAKVGFIKIADRYAYLAQKEMDEFRYSQADHFIRKGLEIDPDNARLLALNREAGRSLPGKIFKSIGNNFKKIAR